MPVYVNTDFLNQLAMLKIGQLFFYTSVIGDTHNYSEQVIIYIYCFSYP